MKFNKPIDKNNVLFKAAYGKTNTATLKNNIATFYFTKKDQVSIGVFTRELSKALLKFKNQNITFDLNSFLDVYHVECKYSLVCIILTKLDAFIEKSFTVKSNPKFGETNLIYRKEYEEIVKKALKVMDSIHYARQFQIMPFNYLGIEKYISEIKRLFKGVNKNIKIKILRQKQIIKEGMGLLNAVNAGGNEQAALVVIEYLNNKSSKDVIGYVGKGVMFDTGGYDIKPLRAMKSMNQDMTGSTIALGSLLALAKNNEKVNVVSFLPLASNLINEKAMQYGDIYKSITGRTVEMVCADAEGRMILADAIGYANKHYKLTKIFSIATLTGLSEICFGDYVIPFWATKSETALALNKASDLSGDILVSLPIFADYFDIVNSSSELADCRNIWEDKTADNGISAAFLKAFCKCDDFTHFDMIGSITFKKHYVNPLTLLLYFFAKNHFKNK